MEGAASVDPLQQVLEERFGLRAFRAGQREVMKALMGGRSALALFPTGAGKSLCYQLPAVLLEGVTLVISPLIALMKDQVEALQSRGIAAARLDSTLSAGEVDDVLERLAGGTLDLLYVAPERLLKESFVKRLQHCRIAMMAIDEAHCISEWGHHFRPEYLRLARVADRLQIAPVLALTATATPQVAADIRAAFGIADADHVQTSFRRPNLHFQITPVSSGDRLDLLADRLTSHPRPAVVYVTLQQTAEQVATSLQRRGLPARAYHAGLSAEHRAEAQEAFMEGSCEIMVATIAFGMGIDKADIRAVYHYNLPKTLENYQQETGRAGRDGGDAHCEMLPCMEDRVVLENFVYGDTPVPSALRQLVDHLLRQGEEFDFSSYELSQATDIRPLVISTVVTRLELEGWIEPLGFFYANYQIRLLEPEERILSGHTEERREFLSRLLKAGEKKRLWTYLDVDAVSLQLNEPRDRVVKALQWLEEAGEVALKPTGLRQRYRRLRSVEGGAVRQVAEAIMERFAEHESREIERLEQVLDLARGPGCLVLAMLRHFGEEGSEPCGECRHCREPRDSPVSIPGEVPEGVSPEDLSVVREVIDENHVALRHPRQLARFLCGLSSPAVRRARLTRHDAYALLERVPFQQVLLQTESMMGEGLHGA